MIGAAVSTCCRGIYGGAHLQWPEAWACADCNAVKAMLTQVDTTAEAPGRCCKSGVAMTYSKRPNGGPRQTRCRAER